MIFMARSSSYPVQLRQPRSGAAESKADYPSEFVMIDAVATNAVTSL